jgi:hypothetical protein
MLHLRVTVGEPDPGSVIVGTPDWPGGGDIRAWRIFLEDFLIFAFLNRQATIVIAPGSPERAYVRDVPEVRAERRRAKFFGLVGGYWVGVVASCSESLLRDIPGANEFDFSELWLTAIPAADLHRADTLVDSPPHDDWPVPLTTEEVLLLVSDGRDLVWLNPSRPIEEIVKTTKELAAKAGWQFEVSARSQCSHAT